MRGRDRDELPGLPDVSWMDDHRTREAGVVGVVEETAHVIEQLADGDRFAIRDEPRQPPFDGVVEAQLAFGDDAPARRRSGYVGRKGSPIPAAGADSFSWCRFRSPQGFRSGSWSPRAN
jgi:hypothetical protein